MRSIWLASAAVIFTAGIAAAQTSPAPTGAPNAPTETPAGSTASPGNTGTGNNMAGPTTAMSAPSAAGSTAPTGATQSPENSPNPAVSPGNMAPSGSTAAAAPAPATDNTSTSTTAMTTPAAKPMHYHAYAGGTLPENASADRYLHIASDAIKHHDKSVADDALSHAETRLLTRAVPASSDMTDDSPRISAIENARHALASGDFQTAADDTRQAMHGHMMGGMGQGSMGDMNSPTTTDQPMPGSPMSNDSASGTSAGNGK